MGFIHTMSERNVIHRFVIEFVKLTNKKIKIKFSLEQATKAHRGSRGIALLFLQPWHWMGVGDQRHA
jgi:hypothetical protein